MASNTAHGLDRMARGCYAVKIKTRTKISSSDAPSSKSFKSKAFAKMRDSTSSAHFSMRRAANHALAPSALEDRPRCTMGFSESPLPWMV